MLVFMHKFKYNKEQKKPKILIWWIMDKVNSLFMLITKSDIL